MALRKKQDGPHLRMLEFDEAKMHKSARDTTARFCYLEGAGKQTKRNTARVWNSLRSMSQEAKMNRTNELPGLPSAVGEQT